jgi:hypothetical protein
MVGPLFVGSLRLAGSMISILRRGETKVTGDTPTQRPKHLVNKNVKYTLEVAGKLYVVENVPARVDVETGEQFFSPSTVERLHSIIRGQAKPIRVMETTVFDYAA